MVIEEQIPQALDGERLDRVVALILDVSRSDASRVVERGGVTVDGAPAQSGKVRLSVGAVVTVDPSVLPPEAGPAPDQAVEFSVVHADSDVVVVNKPAGLVVHPGAGNPDRTLVNGLLARYPQIADVGDVARPGIVHRLDAGTSGLMVVALNERAYAALVDALTRHDVEREYLALVWGVPESARGVVDAPIGRSPRDPLRMAVSADGRPARTHYEVVETHAGPPRAGGGQQHPPVSLLRCRLETGRTHQIRVHLAAIGHPVLGDATYGGSRSGFVCPRPMLHASRLRFVHPGTGEWAEFGCDPPADFVEVAEVCRGR